MRLGVLSDVHGVAHALRAVLDDGARMGVDRWWVLGDLVLFGPDPVEVVEMLQGLEDVAFVGGNTDRYVLTDDQPPAHATPDVAAGDSELVRRFGLMAAGAAWTRGVLDQAGVLGFLDGLPDRQRLALEDGTRLLGVHASPGSDDGPGLDSTSSDEEIRRLLDGVDADWVVGGHTHDPTDREVDGVRVLNPGSVGLPRTPGAARWMLIDAGVDGTTVSHRSVEFDVVAVVGALDRRRHPNREFIASVLSLGTFVEPDRRSVRPAADSTSLHEIGKRHGTDKWDDNHSFRGESYLHIYDRYLRHLRDEPITLLELGVKTGASLRMWQEYFPLAQIHGVDLNPACTVHADERIAVHILSQDDEPGLDDLAESVGGFDVVLDDCSHINVLTLASERILLKHVKPGGFYIIEDLGMSWLDYGEVADPDTFMDGELAMNVARGVDPSQQREGLTRRFEEMIFEMDMLRGDMRFLHFWPNIAIAQKCGP